MNYEMTPEHNRSVVIVFPSLSALPPNPTHQQLAPGIVLTTAWALVRDAKNLTPGFRWLWGDEFAARVLGAASDSSMQAELAAARKRIVDLETSISATISNLQHALKP